MDVQEVIAAANSQPYSHIHQPGLGVGGHCIPVYPHFLLSRAPGDGARRRCRGGSTTARSGVAIQAIQRALGGLEGVPVLVLGLTYRDGVKELAYSRALPLIERLAVPRRPRLGLRPAPVGRRDRALLARRPWRWGDAEPTPGRSSPRPPTRCSRDLDFAWFPDLEVLFDGRNSLRELELPERVAYLGVGVPAAARRRPAAAAAR